MKCKLCNKELKLNSSKNMNWIMKNLELCFSCTFWIEKVFLKSSCNTIRINHNHYMVGDEKESNYFKGFDGQRFRIKLENGKIINTTNLWHQGEIPNHFREILPDNAEFINQRRKL